MSGRSGAAERHEGRYHAGRGNEVSPGRAASSQKKRGHFGPVARPSDALFAAGQEERLNARRLLSSIKAREAIRGYRCWSKRNAIAIWLLAGGRVKLECRTFLAVFCLRRRGLRAMGSAYGGGIVR